MKFEDMNPMQQRLHNAACVLDVDGDEYGFVPLLRETIDALSTAPRKEFEPVEFLLGGTRLKLSFQQEECESCGASSAHFRTVPLDQYAQELQGLWVALVPAENDRHLRMQIPTPNASLSGLPHGEEHKHD